MKKKTFSFTKSNILASCKATQNCLQQFFDADNIDLCKKSKQCSEIAAIIFLRNCSKTNFVV